MIGLSIRVRCFATKESHNKKKRKACCDAAAQFLSIQVIQQKQSSFQYIHKEAFSITSILSAILSSIMSNFPVDFTTPTTVPSAQSVTCTCGKKAVGECNCERVPPLLHFPFFISSPFHFSFCRAASLSASFRAALLTVRCVGSRRKPKMQLWKERSRSLQLRTRCNREPISNRTTHMFLWNARCRRVHLFSCTAPPSNLIVPASRQP